MTIGYIGLGKMGIGQVARLLEHGHKVHAFDSDEVTRQGVEKLGASSFVSVDSLISSLQAPRIIWVMVPWKAVDSVVGEISPLLQKDDLIIDGGNSPYKDSIRRADEATKLGIEYLDAGVSGGPSGARNGACIMVGGDLEVFKKVEVIFKDLALPDGYLYAGKSGAGHFAKMVHNGIEYGMMQSLAEGFTLIRESKFEFDLRALSKLFNTGSVIESRLVGWLSSGYKKYGTELEGISGEVAASGEGKWTVNFAKESGIDVPAIESALAFRERSAGNPTYLGRVLSVLRNQFGGHSIK